MRPVFGNVSSIIFAIFCLAIVEAEQADAGLNSDRSQYTIVGTQCTDGKPVNSAITFVIGTKLNFTEEEIDAAKSGSHPDLQIFRGNIDQIYLVKRFDSKSTSASPCSEGQSLIMSFERARDPLVQKSVECPDVSGVYEIVRGATRINNLMPKIDLTKRPSFPDWATTTQIGPSTLESKITQTRDRLSLGQDSNTYIIDREEHILSRGKIADGFIQTYTIECDGSRIVINENGTNSENSLRPIDTYNSTTVLKMSKDGFLTREVYAKQWSIYGNLSRWATLRQKFKRL